MRFEDLSSESQNSAREVLVKILTTDFFQRNDLSESRAEYLARTVRKSFSALEGETQKMGAGSAGPITNHNEETKP